MENASKALIMAASVILGIMIITFSVFIFGIFKDYNAKNTSQIEEKEDSRFNSEFFKYYENGKDVLKVTPHDIVSIANFAKENNLKYSLNEPKENSYYVTIDVLTKNEKIYNFEKNEQVIKLLQTYLQKEDAVLIKASNGMNFTEISAQLETVLN